MAHDGTLSRILRMKIFLFLSSFFVFCGLSAQEDCEPYGKKIFTLIVNENLELKEEFVDLIAYQRYVDNLPLDDDKKEIMKEHAVDNYIILKKSYLKEANRIIKIYRNFNEDGATFDYQYCSFKANPKYPGIGFIQLFYLAELNGEIIDDSVSFECILTADGWRIIDGFYQENP